MSGTATALPTPTAPAPRQASTHPELARLGMACAQLTGRSPASGCDPGQAFEDAVRGGRPFHEALRVIRAPASPVRYFELAQVSDPVMTLEALLPQLTRADLRARRLEAVGTYALLPATFSTLLCGHLLLVIRPLMLALPRQSSMSPLASQGLAGWLALSALALMSLLALVAALRSRAAPWPFVDVRRRHARALWISGAAVLARQGVPLHRALQTATALIANRSEQHAVARLSSALQRGVVPPPGVADGRWSRLDLQIAQSAATGAGTEFLEALARWCDGDLEARWPQVLFRAELLCLLLAGVAVASSGALFFEQYLGAALG